MFPLGIVRVLGDGQQVSKPAHLGVQVSDTLGGRVGEKGVDVGIAVDMLAKAPEYDAGILISGDVDYMPAIAYIKDRLNYFYQFSLAKGIPPRIRHLSPWLRGVVDSFQSFDELKLLSEFLDRKSGIPPYILDEIDKRIEYLKSL